MGNNLRDSGLLDVNDHPCGPVEWMERARESERAGRGESHTVGKQNKRDTDAPLEEIGYPQRTVMTFQFSLVSKEFIQPLC